METAVIDFLSASVQKENNTIGQSLISQLKELSGSRREILDEVSAARSHHFATGVPALDTMLTYFDRRAEARKMEFTVNVTPDLKAYVPSRISSDDITHLLADLLETQSSLSRLVQTARFVYKYILIGNGLSLNYRTPVSLFRQNLCCNSEYSSLLPTKIPAEAASV